MANLQNIYDRAPIFLQNTMVSVSGAIKARHRYGKVYHEHRAWLEDYDSWSLDRKLEHQAQSLRAFIKFATTKSLFYQRLYRQVDLGGVRTPADLAKLPVLEKESLRSHMQEVYTIDRRHSTEAQTGGTTGKSLVVRYTPEDEMRRMAMLDHFKSRHGFENRSMRKATFSGKHIVPPRQTTPVFWRHNASANQMLYSTFDINEKNLLHYVNHLNEYKPTALDGFFTSICDIASYIERHHIDLTFQPVAIFPTSETVTPRGRALLERVFGAKVYDQYASSEGAPFVTECSAGSLHVELSTGTFENMPASDEILVTSFHTHGTPLIRYRVGDAMQFDLDGHCSCGSNSPLVASIQGRSDDHLVRVDGGKINGGHVANLFKHMPNSVIQAQAIQEELDRIRILLVTDPSVYSADSDHVLRNEFEHAFGPATEILIEHVSEIPRERSGKQRLIRNAVPRSD